MKWASLLLGLLTLPLLFNFTPLEVLRLKTFDAFIETPEPSGNFVILNITHSFRNTISKSVYYFLIL